MELDLLFLQALPLSHQYHALANGRRIYVSDAEKVLAYEEHIYRQYADMKPYFDVILGEYISCASNAKI